MFVRIQASQRRGKGAVAVLASEIENRDTIKHETLLSDGVRKTCVRE